MSRTLSTTSLSERAESLDVPRSVGIADDPADALEARLAVLEDARWSLSFSSAEAAADAVADLVPAGASIVAASTLTPPAEAALARASARGVEVIRVNTRDPIDVAGALRTSTKLLWLASPVGPRLELTDIRAVTTIARLAGVRTVVDNSVWTAANQRPLDLGADLVLYTQTGALLGAAELDLGAIAGRSAELRLALSVARGERSPTRADAGRALLGIETLALRAQKQELNALLVARRLNDNPHIKRVVSPALDSFAQRSIVRRQSTGIGPVLAIEVRGGTARIRAFLSALRLWSNAVALGGNRSAIVPEPGSPAWFTLSAGLEDGRELIADLERALRESAEQAVPEDPALSEAA